ncbi:transglutaminase [Thioclava dalianensis]|uniref:Transglutaminase n=1 Tax=Thioclava dalianensis TaxID=1185766 RepID=A0A074TN19_9RHOB|nr:transglutaminase family protein [Thioclava dalianensis]KEP71565.1 transglutaminase [Thioclava dalianensis]SFN44515.1 Transglutaminase-like enzyme, putative cysteine protease [Thioclava dalianensis]
MLYEVKLRLTYSYDSPTDHARNLLRLLPSDIAGTQVVRARLLTFDPAPSERYESVDFFGTALTSAAWHRPIAEISVQMTAQVERKTAPPTFDFSRQLSDLPGELAAQHSLEPASPHHFLAASGRAGPDPEMTAFARDQLRPGMTVYEAITAVGKALFAQMSFDAQATDVNTPAAEAFAKRHGVCQDFSHIMISALRGIGVPAGYVSGFLRTYPPPGQPRLEGADAMHAWVRAWAGAEMGWVEFDPTNNQSAGEDYITVGYGRDYDDVPPLRGAMRGAGGQESAQAVDVIPQA